MLWSIPHLPSGVQIRREIPNDDYQPAKPTCMGNCLRQGVEQAYEALRHIKNTPWLSDASGYVDMWMSAFSMSRYMLCNHLVQQYSLEHNQQPFAALDVYICRQTTPPYVRILPRDLYPYNLALPAPPRSPSPLPASPVLNNQIENNDVPVIDLTSSPDYHQSPQMSPAPAIGEDGERQQVQMETNIRNLCSTIAENQAIKEELQARIAELQARVADIDASRSDLRLRLLDASEAYSETLRPAQRQVFSNARARGNIPKYMTAVSEYRNRRLRDRTYRDFNEYSRHLA
ncbi:hypothetical protein BX666DRAFT_2067718 [Dichotomocladium elegans]|nr:hypothetical protein BX666DRAFT_2067718 [Dichotomocladium elegans]